MFEKLARRMIKVNAHDTLIVYKDDQYATPGSAGAMRELLVEGYKKELGMRLGAGLAFAAFAFLGVRNFNFIWEVEEAVKANQTWLTVICFTAAAVSAIILVGAKYSHKNEDILAECLPTGFPWHSEFGKAERDVLFTYSDVDNWQYDNVLTAIEHKMMLDADTGYEDAVDEVTQGIDARKEY